MTVGHLDTFGYLHNKHFLQCYFLKNRRSAARTLSKIGRLFLSSHALLPAFVALPFSDVLFLFLVLISENIHPNLDPIFSCSVCADKVFWRGRSVLL